MINRPHVAKIKVGIRVIMIQKVSVNSKKKNKTVMFQKAKVWYSK